MRETNVIDYSPACTFAICTFNIDGDHHRRGQAKAWAFRKTHVVRILQELSPDVFGLQEVQITNTPFSDVSRVDAKSDFDRYNSFSGALDGENITPEQSLNPIFWRAELWKLLQTGAFCLSETPLKPSRGWDSIDVRRASWVLLLSRATGIPIIFMNVHLDSFGVEARQEAAVLIAKHMKALCERHASLGILFGDFNSRPWIPERESSFTYGSLVNLSALPIDNRPYKTLIAAGFVDIHAVADGGAELLCNTYHDYLGTRFPPAALRIDWLLSFQNRFSVVVNSVKVPRGGLAEEASDHYALTATLTLKRDVASASRLT